MKRRIWNWIGIAIMAAAIAFSLIQLQIPVVRAAHCPDAGSVGCNCNFLWEFAFMRNGQMVHECHYSCSACTGNPGEPMVIEQEVVIEVPD